MRRRSGLRARRRPGDPGGPAVLQGTPPAIHFVDLRRKPIAPGVLRRFTDRLGAAAVLDTEGLAYRSAGLGHLRMDDREIVERLLADPRLLRLPLVRRGNDVSAGPAEATWRAWLAASG
jgi:arsenate reductase-like glutaredoxin family protein